LYALDNSENGVLLVIWTPIVRTSAANFYREECHDSA